MFGACAPVILEIKNEDVELTPMWGEGYAIPSKEGNDAVKFMARNEGIILDPVYTGKAFAGLQTCAR